MGGGGMYIIIYLLAFSIPIIAGLVAFLIINKAIHNRGRQLQQKFVSLGVLQGKSLAEIQAVCGNPTSISYRADGVKVYQWIAAGYHIVLLFDKDDICLGVSSETAV